MSTEQTERYWAHISEGIVTNVIVADQDFIDAHPDDTWVETWIDISHPRDADGMVITVAPSNADKRYNPASIGGRYDSDADAFIPAKGPGQATWVLDANTKTWQPPVPYPQPSWWTSLTHDQRRYETTDAQKESVKQYKWVAATAEWVETGWDMLQLYKLRYPEDYA